MSDLPPIFNIEAEQALLGAIFVNNQAFGRVSSIVAPEHFYEPIHAKLFDLCGDAILEGRAATPITLKPKLPSNLDIAGLTPIEYMARLCAEATTVINAPDYAMTVRDAWAARQVVDASREAAASVSAPDANVKGIITSLFADLDGIRARIDDRRSVSAHIADCASGVLRRVDAIRDGTIEQGATTGLRDLDRRVGGLHPGRLVIVAGRPGMGKSIVGANIARATAAAGNGCLLFSLEMAEEEIGARVLSDQAFGSSGPYHLDQAIASKDIFEGRLDNHQLAHVAHAGEALARLPLIVNTSAALTVGEILADTRRKADEMKARGVSLRVVVIDYLKFVRASDRYHGQRVYEVGEITAGLKALAKDLGVCVVLLAQLNRAVEQRSDKRPELSDLRESGDIEADADIVMLLFREAYYLKDKTDADSQARLMACENTLEIIVAKCRMGAVGVVQAFCHPGASVVRDWGALQ